MGLNGGNGLKPEDLAGNFTDNYGGLTSKNGGFMGFNHD